VEVRGIKSFSSCLQSSLNFHSPDIRCVLATTVCFTKTKAAFRFPKISGILPGNGWRWTISSGRPRSRPMARTSSLWKSFRGSTTRPYNVEDISTTKQAHWPLNACFHIIFTETFWNNYRMNWVISSRNQELLWTSPRRPHHALYHIRILGQTVAMPPRW